ncbi:MAG: hypothetical protein ACFCGT_04610 [Sandaracinaceae bacterium]
MTESPSSVSVRCAFTLRGKLGQEERARVRRWLEQEGLELTTLGRATVAFRAPPEVVERLFQGTVVEVPARRASAMESGRPPGHRAVGDLEVPSELADIVAYVTVEQPATRLDRGADEPSRSS